MHLSFASIRRLVNTKPFIVFSLILILKAYLAWLIVFDLDISIAWGPLVTEVPFICIIFCLIEWFASKRKLLYYMIANLLFTGLFFAVIMYYQYYGVIATVHALDQVNQVTAVSNSVFSLIHPYFLLIFTDIVILFYMSFRYRHKLKQARPSVPLARRSVLGAVILASAMLCLLNVVPNRASMNELKKAEGMGILNYEAYTILGREKKDPIPQHLITQEAVNELKGVTPPASPAYKGAARGKNLLILQMESMQTFLIGLTIDGKEITPNMNKLVREGFYFPRFYQNVGQGNTSDAEFVVNTSFYVPPVGAASGVYATKNLPSLPRLSASNGYDTATFHTNIVEFWNRGEMYKALGWNRYYDMSFFGEEDRVFFSASDEVLYEKTADELARMQAAGKPFYAQLISETAHHPYTIPESKWKMELPKRFEGTLVGDYIRAQNYSDWALGLFIEELKRNGVWRNSLVVAYGDHQGLPIFSLTRGEKELMKELYGREYGYQDMINIPLVIWGEGVTHPAEFPQAGGQIDILPTVANLLDFSLDNQLHFGQDLLNTASNLIPERYYLPSGSVVGSSLFIPGEGYEDGTSYSLEDGTPSPADQGGVTEEQYENALRLLHYSDSYLTQLPDRES